MSGKRMQDYIAVFNEIKGKITSGAVKRFVLDYEKAA